METTADLATNSITTDIAVGDMQLFDYYEPPLRAGNYFITVEQRLTSPQTDQHEAINQTFGAQQEFLVTGPQFTLSATQIVNRYPLAGSTGKYGDVLPHIVLKDPMLAWEREMEEGQKNRQVDPTPWLALLVFDEEELLFDALLPNGQPATDSKPDTKAMALSVGDFLELKKPVKVPVLHPEADVSLASACLYIKMPTEVFLKVAPRFGELPYLSHVRKVNTGDRPILGLNEHGLFSVTMANRFASTPQAPAGPAAASATPLPARKNIVHLVSLEGWAPYLPTSDDATENKKALKDYSHVALVSLASWSFFSQANPELDFEALVKNLAAKATTDAAGPRADLLRLQLQPVAGAASAADAEARQRLGLGYVPLAYHSRSGENTFAWYRGPLSPQLMSTPPLGPFFSADAALIYDTSFDTFDASLAAAWEVGRQAALSDLGFGPRLRDFRRRTYRLADDLLHRLKSDHFPLDASANINALIAQVDLAATVEDTFLSLLTPKRLQAMGAVGFQAAASPPPPTPAAVVAGPSDLVSQLNALLDEKATLTQFQQMLRDDIGPMAEWLARLLLLYPVPFDSLVPDERLLPAESLRFFYVDANWLSAAIDGALSLGLDSSKHTRYSRLIKDLVLAAAQQAQAATRDKLLGRPASASPAPTPTVVSGFLLRSALVSGWPNLAVYPKDAQGKPLTILRIEHLAPSVLLCLLDGVPDTLVFSEPNESLRFGVNDNGEATLRHIVSTKTPALQDTVKGRNRLKIGAQLISQETSQAMVAQVRKAAACLRAPTPGERARVLNINPTDPAGLLKTLEKALPYGAISLTPSAFAMQLINAPEAVLFSLK
jgi:hypothetical protein